MSSSGILSGTGLSATLSSGSGTVTSVSVVTANGFSGSVATATTTPAITLTASGLSPSVITGTAAVLTANTFTATQTVNPAANTSAIAVSGGSITGSGTTPFASVAGTWNTAGVATGVSIAITDTASGTNSRFLSLLGGTGGATERFYVDRLGVVVADFSAGGRFLVSSGTTAASNACGMTYRNSQCLSFTIGTLTTQAEYFEVQAAGAQLRSDGVLGWWSATTPTAPDTGITRKAAKIVEINNGTAGTYVGTAFTTGSQTVAQLPAAATAGAGARSFVTDANTTVILGLGLTVVGSGSNKVPVYSDGTNWIVG